MSTPDSRAPVKELDDVVQEGSSHKTTEEGSGEETTGNVFTRLIDNRSNYSLRYRVFGRRSLLIWNKEQQRYVGRITRKGSSTCKVRDYEQKRNVGEINSSGLVFVEGECRGYNLELRHTLSDKFAGSPERRYIKENLGAFFEFLSAICGEPRE